LFDIAVPWQCLLIGLASPFVMLLSERLVAALGIDDPKIAPLALGPAVFSALTAGIIGKGVPTGGLPGLTGAYGFQHAHMSLRMQVLGIVVTIGFSAVSALVLVFLLERTSGLRVSSAAESEGLDATTWQIPADANT
jgi:ammonia channel protein AmtB